MISHEFFHTWNVKQLRPKGFTPYDYTKENYTEELWIAEGSTSYYDGLIVLRTGQISIEDFYNEITRAVEEDRKRPGNNIQSLAESSFDAWVKFWKFTQQRINTETDYYGKGAAVFNNSLYFGTSNTSNGAEVWQMLNKIYLPLVLR